MIKTLNQLGKTKTPFLFVIDFDIENFYIAPLVKLDKHIFFAIDGFSNFPSNLTLPKKAHHSYGLKKKPSVWLNIPPHLIG
jgi:hypothetical protein